MSAAVEQACVKALLLTQDAMGRRSQHWRGPDYADGLDAGIETTVGLVRDAMTTPAPTTYVGEDRELGVEYLLHIWPDGHHEVATRTLTVRTWSPPVVLVRQAVGS